MTGTDIFLSYADEDRERIVLVAGLLEARGWSVFWDRRIPAGETWRSYLRHNLEHARCVIVAWSEHSTKSEWIIEEADEAKGRNILVPVLLEDICPPRCFRSTQAVNLARWTGNSSPETIEFLNTVANALTPSEPKKEMRFAYELIEHQSTSLRYRIRDFFVLIFGIAIIALYIYLLW